MRFSHNFGLLRFIKKKMFFLFLLSILYAANVFSQDAITINAFVLDKKNKKPLQYVNIGFLGKGIGTVSQSDGNFILSYDERKINNEDILQLSILGYKSKQIKAADLFDIFSNNNRIYLTPTPFELNEVVISNKKQVKERIGNASHYQSSMGYWKDKDGLGGEISTKIKIRRKNTRLLDVKFNIIENLSDSIKVRLNIYEYKKGYPQQNILKQNIFHTISRKSGKETIDLSLYQISVDKDVVISLELVEVYGNNIGFAISANNQLGTSFTKLISQDNWKRYTNTVIGISVLTSFSVDKDSKVSRNKPKSLLIYWDQSISMLNRNLEKELELLEKYLSKIRPRFVQVIKFSDDINEKREFVYNKMRVKNVLNYIKNTNYDGGTNFNNVLKETLIKFDAALLFSDGNQSFEILENETTIPVFTINSSEYANHSILQNAAFYSDGHYLNLMDVSPRQALDYMINVENDYNDYSNVENQMVEGIVVGDSIPIQGAVVRVRNTFEETQTDSYGKFKLKAKKGDILDFRFLGMKPKEIRVINKNARVTLEPTSEMLQEVMVNTDVYNKRLIDLGLNNKKSEDGIGYSVNSLNSQNIGIQYTNLSDLIKGRFAGVTVSADGTVWMRGRGSISAPAPAIYDLDGSIYSGGDLPYVNPQEIETITLLKSLASTTRYGNIGRGGVIMIRTQKRKPSTSQERKSALLKGNDYNEQISLIKDSITSKVVQRLISAKTFKEAKERYFQFDKSTFSIPDFIEISDYFNKWNKHYSNRILSSISELAYNNAKALKILAYKLEQKNQLNKAKVIYERISQLQPHAAQSYINLARIYKETEYYSRSMDLYKKMISNSIAGIDFSISRRLLESELKHLITQYRTKVNFKDLPNDLRKIGFKYDIRIELEWTDPNIEFELQFVNPNRKFFNWSHTLLDDSVDIIDSIKNGYNSEEFIIDDAESGEWIINIRNITDEELKNPTYLKYTVYKNYGLENESKSIKIIKLFQQKEKVTLDRFIY